MFEEIRKILIIFHLSWWKINVIAEDCTKEKSNSLRYIFTAK